jgi:hypothetical protein
VRLFVPQSNSSGGSSSVVVPSVASDSVEVSEVELVLVSSSDEVDALVELVELVVDASVLDVEVPAPLPVVPVSPLHADTKTRLANARVKWPMPT